MKKTICDLCQQDIDTPCKKGDFDHVKVRIEAVTPNGPVCGGEGHFDFEMCLNCVRTLQIYPQPYVEGQPEFTRTKRLEKLRETLKVAMHSNRAKGM